MLVSTDNRLQRNWSSLLNLNTTRLIYLALFVSVALQQFRFTEPAAPGVFWLTIATMFVAHSAMLHWGHRKRAGLTAWCVVTVLGIATQVALTIIFWDNLVAFDEVARDVRTAFGRGNPLTPMRVVLGLATIPLLVSVRRHGLIRWPNEWVVTRWL